MLSAVKKALNDMPLRHKMNLIIVFVSLVFVGGISLVGLRLVVNANNELLYSTLEASLGYSASELQNNLRTLENISRAMVTDFVLQEQLAALKESPEDTVVRAAVFREMGNQLHSYQEQFVQGDVVFLNVDAEDMTVSTNTARTWRIDAQILQDLRAQAVVQSGRSVWYLDGEYLLLVRAARRTQPLRLDTLGVVTICLDLENVILRCTNFRGSFDESYYMLLENNTTLYATAGMDEALQALCVQMEEPYRVLRWNGHRYFAVRNAVPGQSWEYVSLVSYDSIDTAVTASMGVYTLVMLLALGLSVVLCNILMKRITRHIDNLLLKMKAFGQNNAQKVSIGCDYTGRNDELGILHQRFDRMADEIVDLIEIDYTNKLLMKDAQIKALETQIDPHFLYNVLASVNWRAKAIGEKDISQMVEALSNLLRATLSDSAEPFTLQKEMALVQSYATIQQLRFEDQLCITLAVPPALHTAALPKLTVQPLVENAIRYAMEQSTEPCEIHIAACKTEENLQITVANTGSRFPENFAEKLRQGSVEIHGFGIGLANIHSRLQLTFGEPYGLQFYNTATHAVVTLTVPYRPTTD